MSEVFYIGWQNQFRNKECNNGIANYLLRDGSNFVKLIEKNQISATWMKNCINTYDIGFYFDTAIKRNQNKNISLDLNSGLNRFGIIENTMLYNHCKDLFYIVCNTPDYLLLQKSQMLNIVYKIEKMGLFYHQRFLENFISSLTLKQLSKYEYLIQPLQKTIGELHTEKFHKYFYGIKNEEIKTKYQNWVIRATIGQLFGYDERSVFWKEYAYINARKYPTSNSVVLECAEYFVVEFLGQARGPLYIYERPYFEKIVRRKLGRYSNNELRQELYHHTNHRDGGFQDGGYRKPHASNWQRDVRRIIQIYGITFKIDVNK